MHSVVEVIIARRLSLRLVRQILPGQKKRQAAALHYRTKTLRLSQSDQPEGLFLSYGIYNLITILFVFANVLRNLLNAAGINERVTISFPSKL